MTRRDLSNEHGITTNQDIPAEGAGDLYGSIFGEESDESDPSSNPDFCDCVGFCGEDCANQSQAPLTSELAREGFEHGKSDETEHGPMRTHKEADDFTVTDQNFINGYLSNEGEHATHVAAWKDQGSLNRGTWDKEKWAELSHMNRGKDDRNFADDRDKYRFKIDKHAEDIVDFVDAVACNAELNEVERDEVEMIVREFDLRKLNYLGGITNISIGIVAYAIKGIETAEDALEHPKMNTRDMQSVKDNVVNIYYLDDSDDYVEHIVREVYDTLDEEFELF